MLAFAVQCSPTHASRFAVLAKSLKRFHPDWPVVVYGYDGYAPAVFKCGTATEIPTDRAWIIRDMLSRFERVCFLGADTELFAPLVDAERIASAYDLAICPHMFGQAAQCNADFQLWRRSANTDRILDWYDANIRAYPDEQRCLSRIPFAFPNTLVWHQRTHNVAYYNVREYGLVPKWRTQDGPLVLFHYSAFDPERPERMSRHHHGPDATGPIRWFYQRYARLLKQQVEVTCGG